MAGATLRARTNFPQIEPRINSQIVIIVPRKLDRILPDRFRRHCLRRCLEHRQSSGRKLRRLSRFALCLRPLIFAKRTRTSVPQKCKRVDRPVSVLPLDLHTRAGRQIDLDRLRIIRHTRAHIRQRHKFQYRTRHSHVPVTGILQVTLFETLQHNLSHLDFGACYPMS